MGLITKEVKVRLYSRNIKHFEKLGYQIPRTKRDGRMCVPGNTFITVKTSDLMPGSDILVDIECDCCKTIVQRPYNHYVYYNHDGKYYCKKCALKVLNSGENNPKWNVSLSEDERNNNRNYPEYDDFIKRVMARDDYTCQCCGKTNNSLDVHHLDGYNWCIKKRTDETNAVVLCKTCHGNFHSIYGRGNNTKNQYEEWIGYTIRELKKYNGVLPTTRKIFDYERNKIYNSSSQYAQVHNVNKSTVIAACNRDIRHKKIKRKDGSETPIVSISYTVKGHHLFWLDEYKNMTQEEILNIVNKKHNKWKSVICTTTGKIFDTIIDGGNKYKINSPSNIGTACKGKIKSCGSLPDGTPLKWMYYDDFLKLSQEEQNEILKRNTESSNDGSFYM